MIDRGGGEQTAGLGVAQNAECRRQRFETQLETQFKKYVRTQQSAAKTQSQTAKSRIRRHRFKTQETRGTRFKTQPKRKRETRVSKRRFRNANAERGQNAECETLSCPVSNTGDRLVEVAQGP